MTVEVADAAGEGAAEDRFNLVVKRGGQVVETFESVTTKRGKDNVVTRGPRAVQADHASRRRRRPASWPGRAAARWR